jgi:hypothetical protein
MLALAAAGNAQVRERVALQWLRATAALFSQMLDVISAEASL